ncbi:MAG: dihydropteroate synthase [Bacilli bacterium]|nr:dihydropteroate synthase [Bacilli bacterium]
MLEIKFGKKILKTDRPAFIMGILNATPDSFWAGSRGGIEKAFELIDQGADVLDIGGESTRPGFRFTEISPEEQISRIIPIIKEIRKKSDIGISVDTRNSQVLKAALDAGADVLNDVSALEDDAGCTSVIKQYDAGLILMHGYHDSENHKSMNNISEKVLGYLLNRAEFAVSLGVKKENIIIDPGIGFGKTTEENITLIKETEKMCNKGFPVLMALSRKRCIGTMMERENTAENRMVSTVAANLLSVQKGALMVRVHDVQEMIDSLNVMKYLR